jgi:hypothetical protein
MGERCVSAASAGCRSAPIASSAIAISFCKDRALSVGVQSETAPFGRLRHAVIEQSTPCSN